MKAVFFTALAVISATTLGAAEAQSVMDDPYAGYYEGVFPSRDGETKVEAQIRALGGGKYGGFIVFNKVGESQQPIANLGVLEEFQPKPGQTNLITGFHPNPRGAEDVAKRLEFTWPAIPISGDLLPGQIKGRIFAEMFGRSYTNHFDLVRQSPKPSPTLGAKAPAGAIVVFDNQDRGQWKEAKWKTVNGALEVGKGNITTKQSLKNFLLHVEFRTPFMPAAEGQARGNSGVYLRSVFEVQVLDSFGLFPLAFDDVGGIYQVAEPDWRKVNASFPPGEWQTYDITYREGDEKSKRLPEVTVVHNGKTIIDRVKIPERFVINGTGGGEVDGGFLMLQDHGNPVQYRNIWAQPLE